MTSRRSSGSMPAESAAEPTRSENITVTCRRSAVSLAVSSIAEKEPGDVAFTPASARRAAMALSSLRRCPTASTPNSFKSSAVKLGRTESSIAFLRNAASYCSRPRLRSQTPRSIIASYLRRRVIIIQAKQRVRALATPPAALCDERPRGRRAAEHATNSRRPMPDMGAPLHGLPHHQPATGAAGRSMGQT